MTITQAKKALIAVAVSNIGYKETSDNIIKFAAGTWDNEFYGWELQGQPWCDLYADYCYCQAFGNKLGAAMTYQRLGAGSALCRTSAQYYKNNNAYYNYPEVGDQVFFYYSGDINHTGIVETVSGSNSNWTSFTTIEGNTSDSVGRRTYYRGNPVIAVFGRPKLSLVVDNNESTEKPEIPSTPTSTPTTSVQLIRFGARGEKVKKIQEQLIKLDYNCGKDGADGVFGLNTLKAVLNFQKDYQLEADGVVGPLTEAALEKAVKLAKGKEETTTTPSTPTQTITFKKGDEVKIKPGATYYDGRTVVPDFVLNDTWIVYVVNGDRVVISKNKSGTNNIMSPINAKDLIKV